MPTQIPDQSVFRRVGVGYAAQDLNDGLHDLEVLNVEWFGYSSGTLDEGVTKLTYTGVDISGKTHEVTVEASITIKAKWQAAQNNRMVPPRVVKGERVEIYQVSDTDQYYWRSMGVDEHLRKNDSVVLGVANKKERTTEPLDDSNTYYAIIDSKNKVVKLHTGTSDGEPYAYDVQIDTKVGNLLITDDVGNSVHINSSESRVELTNASGSTMVLLEDLFKVVASKVEYVCSSFKINTQGFTLSTNSYTATATSYSVTSDSYKHNGVDVGSTHTHGGVIPGGSKTTPPT